MGAQRPFELEVREGSRLLDRYVIDARIASGGMATIYRATDDRLDRTVCVKLLRRRLASERSRAVYDATYAHFLQEAHALSRLQHPNTLRIYDFGYFGGASQDSPDGMPFQVSEYLDGGTLDGHVRARGALPPAEAVGILGAITEAVAEAHAHGILHRDIKPSNILFGRVRDELVPKLADFGIADRQLTDADTGEHAPPSVALYSPRWAAPEQLAAGIEGPQADVYALGLLAVFMLTGKVLFGDEDIRTTFVDRARGGPMVAERVHRFGLPREVTEVIMHALASRPEARIASAPELQRRLRDALRVPQPVSVAPFRAAPQAAIARPASFAPPASVDAVPSSRRRNIRYVAVQERVDLSFDDAHGDPVRVRVTMLHGPAGAPMINIKGLSCFVGKRGARPSPAMTATADGAADLVSSRREHLGEVRWSFGELVPEGRAFVADGERVLVPFTQARDAVALTLGHDGDIVVMWRR